MASRQTTKAQAQGGPYSKGTVDLLAKMMGESKLTVHQQKVLRDSMNAGRALPASGPPPSLYRREKAPALRPSSGPWEDPYRGVAINPNMTHGMGRVPQSRIVTATNGYAREAFVGGARIVDREKQKEDLADLFAYGANAPDRSSAPVTHDARAAARAAASNQAPRSEVERLHEKVSTEIEERQAFIAEMRALGQTKHEATIRGEIAQRMQELKRLEQLMKQQHQAAR